MSLSPRFLLPAALALAACSASEPLAIFGAAKVADKADDTVGSLRAGPALWDDPQNTPHPMFNWPTLSHPPAAAKVPAYWVPPPARALPGTVSGIRHLTRADEIPRGAGLAAFGSLIVLPGFGSDSSVIDIRDPARPKRLSTFGDNGANFESAAADPEVAQRGHVDLESRMLGADRGAAIIAYPSGRLVTVLSTSSEIESWDITDPAEPRPLPPLVVPNSHKLGVVPGTPLVYNAGSRGGGQAGNLMGTDHTEIFDLSDPDDPQFVQDFQNGYSCHHIFFWNNPQQNKFRAICAGVEVTQIWDTADPRNPKVIVTLPVHHGVPGTPSAAVLVRVPGVIAIAEAFSHSAGLNRAGDILYVGDENGGGGLPPGCVASVATPAGDISAPIGAIWFYDISTETSPRLKGWWSAANNPTQKSATATCTAHHGRLVPDPDRDLLAMAFYGDGVILIDFSNPMLPRAVGQFVESSNTWEAWYYNGYLFTGDLARGLDVLTFD